MAPTETQILENYLLRPAGLEAVVTYEWFAERFPPAQRDSPQVRALWQDLVAQRERALGAVRAAVEAEARRGVAMRREVLRERRQAEAEELDGEIELERALFGAQSGAKSAKHSLDSIIPELEGAAGALEIEIEKLKAEEGTLLESVKQTVGNLSDLRYGKFANANIKDDVLESLTALQDVCADKT